MHGACMHSRFRYAPPPPSPYRREQLRKEGKLLTGKAKAEADRLALVRAQMLKQAEERGGLGACMQLNSRMLLVNRWLSRRSCVRGCWSRPRSEVGWG